MAQVSLLAVLTVAAAQAKVQEAQDSLVAAFHAYTVSKTYAEDAATMCRTIDALTDYGARVSLFISAVSAAMVALSDDEEGPSKN